MNAVARPELSLQAFEARTIDPGTFDHEAHVHIAWLYLRQYPLAEAIGRFTDTLQRLTVEIGAKNKYHETISWFFLLLIAERRAKTDSDSWLVFRRDNHDLFSSDDNVLSRYYSDELLWSDHARRSFFLPDRLV